MVKVSFRTEVLRVREEAILAAVNRLLADRGYDLMTMDQVAADVGISKVSLYKHFASKEELAAATMIRALDRTMACITALNERGPASALAKLKEVVRWALRVQLAGEMPSLPTQNSVLRSSLIGNTVYMGRLVEVSDRLGEWIVSAQADVDLDPSLPPEVVLYTLFSRGCDPVLGVLKASGNYSDERIVELLVATCFGGLAGRASPG